MEEVVNVRDNGQQISSKYRITSDGRMNIILQKLTPMRDGKGKSANIIGSQWKDEAWFGSSIKGLAYSVNNRDVMDVFDEVEQQETFEKYIDKLIKHLDEREQRLYEHFNKNITLDLKNTKDTSGDSDGKK